MPPIFFFVEILLLLSIEPTTPVPSRVASQWRERPSSYNGDHNGSEMAGAPPVGRRTRTTRTTPSKYVRTTLPAENTPRLGFWSRVLVAGHAPHRRHLPSTCGRHCSSEHTSRPGFWSHQLPASWQYKPLRSGTAQAPPIRLVCSALCQHVAQYISASCQHKPQDRPSTCTFFALRGSKAYMHDTPRTTILESTLQMTIDGVFAC